VTSKHFQWQGQDLLLFCHLQPGASKNEFCGLHGDRLKIRIKAPPVDGKANAAIIDFLSKEFAVPKSHIKIEQGELGRQKNIRVESPKKIPEPTLVIRDKQ
jgi:uncharacterized protein (TIGR00251 family)